MSRRKVGPVRSSSTPGVGVDLARGGLGGEITNDAVAGIFLVKREFRYSIFPLDTFSSNLPVKLL